MIFSWWQIRKGNEKPAENEHKKWFPADGDAEQTWEQRKLGNCGATYSGLSGKTKEDFGHGNARFVPYTNVFDNPLTDTKRLEAVEIDSSQNRVAYGDVFFTVSSETPDEVGMSSVWLSDQEDVYLNSFCFGYRQDSTFDSHYLAYMLRSSSIRSDLVLLAQGISRFNISKNKVMELSVPVPSVAEQKQIGQYFARLDSLITLHQRKLDVARSSWTAISSQDRYLGSPIPELCANTSSGLSSCWRAQASWPRSQSTHQQKAEATRACA